MHWRSFSESVDCHGHSRESAVRLLAMGICMMEALSSFPQGAELEFSSRNLAFASSLLIPYGETAKSACTAGSFHNTPAGAISTNPNTCPNSCRTTLRNSASGVDSESHAKLRVGSPGFTFMASVPTYDHAGWLDWNVTLIWALAASGEVKRIAPADSNSTAIFITLCCRLEVLSVKLTPRCIEGDQYFVVRTAIRSGDTTNSGLLTCGSSGLTVAPFRPGGEKGIVR